jgi:hypothetical protein
MVAAIVAVVMQQVFTLAGAAITSGVITTLLTQALKWKAIAIPATKYPVQVAAVLSLAVSACAVYGLNAIQFDNALAYVTFSLVTLLVSTQSYDLAKEAISRVKKNS